MPIQQAGTPAPAPPVPPIPQAIINGVPRTLADVQTLRAQRTELSNQLQSAQGRRDEIADALREVTNTTERAGLEARLQLLDGRILQIESDIERTGQLISQAPGEFLRETSSTQDFPVNFGGERPDVTAIAVVFTMFVLTPLSIAAARLLWRRATRGPVQPAIDRESAERLRRLESGVDAIAIEVERISEGQRFVTKLMAERDKQRIEAGS